jgi:hypothetical protein
MTVTDDITRFNFLKRPLTRVIIFLRSHHLPFMQQPQTHRGLKDTERKPLGHLYLGVTLATMSSAVQILTQIKAWTGIMAAVVCSCI